MSLSKLNALRLTEPYLIEEKWLKKLFGPKSRIGDALGRLHRLTQDEARRSTSQVLKAIIMSKDEDINKSAEIVYGMKTSVDREKQSNTEEPRWKGRKDGHARKGQGR